VLEGVGIIFTVNSNLNQHKNAFTMDEHIVNFNASIIDSGIGDPQRTFTTTYSNGTAAALSFNNTEIFFDFYDGVSWSRIWTK
jgi:hypothetical protein